MDLRTIGKANMVLGTVSLVRVITEIVFFWNESDRSNFQAFALFDLATAALWTVSGHYLLSRHEWSLPMTGMAAGAAAARTIISMMLLGPVFARSLWRYYDHPEYLRILCAVSGRFLHYGIEFVYWPVVLFTTLQASEQARPRGERDPGLATGSAFAATGVIAAILEAALIDPLT